jgi:hypothetical protein
MIWLLIRRKVCWQSPIERRGRGVGDKGGGGDQIAGRGRWGGGLPPCGVRDGRRTRLLPDGEVGGGYVLLLGRGREGKAKTDTL